MNYEDELLSMHVFDTVELEEGERVARWAWSEYVGMMLDRPPTQLYYLLEQGAL